MKSDMKPPVSLFYPNKREGGVLKNGRSPFLRTPPLPNEALKQKTLSPVRGRKDRFRGTTSIHRLNSGALITPTIIRASLYRATRAGLLSFASKGFLRQPFRATFGAGQL
jgi:hypothetical protein